MGGSNASHNVHFSPTIERREFRRLSRSPRTPSALTRSRDSHSRKGDPYGHHHFETYVTSSAHSRILAVATFAKRKKHTDCDIWRLGPGRHGCYGLQLRHPQLDRRVAHQQERCRVARHRRPVDVLSWRLAGWLTGGPFRTCESAADHHCLVCPVHILERLYAEFLATAPLPRVARFGVRWRVGSWLRADG